MNVKTIRNLFISFLIFLPIQYILVGIVGFYKTEPWPAFVFPGFKNVYFQNNTFQISQTYFELYDFDNELIEKLQAYSFFSDIPRSQVSGFMNTHFSDSSQVEQLSTEAKRWLKTNSSRLTEQHVGSIRIVRLNEYYTHFEARPEIDSVNFQFTVEIQLDE